MAGGLATQIGTDPNLVAGAYVKLPFVQWMSFGVPLAIVLMLLVWRTLASIFPDEVKIDLTLRPNSGKLGSMTYREKYTLAVLVAVIVLLITAPVTGIDADAVTLIGAALLLVSGTLNWKDAQKNVDWGTIIFFGSALSVGNTLLVTGAAKWMIQTMMGSATNFMLPVFIVLILMLIGTSLTQVISNIGLAAILVPIATTLAEHMNVSAATFVVPVAVACSLSFMFPISDPTIAMAHGTGYVRSRDIFKAGFPITVIAIGIAVVTILAVFRLI